MVRIGFVGIGVMGKYMCQHLMASGHTATVFSRTAAKCCPLVSKGATFCYTPREVAAASDVVFTMVSQPTDVRDVVFNPETGIFAGLRNGGTFVDMTTSTPSLAVEIAREAETRGFFALDAPVSGGDIGAKAGTLSIMCGGDRATFDAVRPLLDSMGKNVRLMGGAGSGQHTKMCNQILACNNMIGVCESLLYAQKAGLDAEAVIEAIGAGAAGSWAVNNLGKKVAKRDLAPGFMVQHMVKDLRIALEEANAMGLKLPGLELAERMYALLLEHGYGKDGTQALVIALERLSEEQVAS
ncbi:2-hydroxy-3-oxopropionate reductase [Pavlovales sp. CCMP2436]|nr:2-hydroxy-3-oxopropionate reductase [Pavlovales sp. CCMP2436]|mmetsp:Transcript_10009/g.25168  ORF Transcript_10009/g.25168 Transcript_10009/m.25168 type:complete len:297 (-) Transcript_10009:97-987(-)